MLPATEKKKLVGQLDRTIGAIEDILTTGLTTASQTTYQTFAVTFQEAARLKLLRLGSTLRSTHEEITRYVNDDARFSQSRLMFFLNRSWLLGKSITQAAHAGDDQRLAELLGSSPTRPVSQIEVVCLGVVKKIAAGNFCAFEFRLRSLADGQPLTWSTVFPMKTGAEIPAEGFLHLPQKQKFTANVFLDGKTVCATNVLISENADGARRLQLTDESTVVAADEFSQWQDYLRWDIAAAIQRIELHEISPFDVDVELQEEVFFEQYTLGPSRPQVEFNRLVFPLHFRDTEFDVVVADGVEGESAKAALTQQGSAKTPKPLYGLLHYAGCRLIVQPLTLWDDGNPKYITISDKSVDRQALLAALKFT